jgi:hypothetical protein
MYWFQDIESARALARLFSESPHPPCGDAVPQSNPDQLPQPVAAEPLIDESAADDAGLPAANEATAPAVSQEW